MSAETVVGQADAATGPHLLLDVGFYWRINGQGLTAVTIVGFLVNIVWGNHAGADDFYRFDWVHNSAHAVAAAYCLALGYMSVPRRVSRVALIPFGVVFAALGVMGFLAGTSTFLLGFLHVQMGNNILHFVFGVWALIVLFAGAD